MNKEQRVQKMKDEGIEPFWYKEAGPLASEDTSQLKTDFQFDERNLFEFAVPEDVENNYLYPAIYLTQEPDPKIQWWKVSYDNSYSKLFFELTIDQFKGLNIISDEVTKWLKNKQEESKIFHEDMSGLSFIRTWQSNAADNSKMWVMFGFGKKFKPTDKKAYLKKGCITMPIKNWEQYTEKLLEVRSRWNEIQIVESFCKTGKLDWETGL